MRACFVAFAFAVYVTAAAQAQAQAPSAGTPATSGHAQPGPVHAQKASPGAHPSAPAPVPNAAPDVDQEILDKAMADVSAAHQRSDFQPIEPETDPRVAKAYSDYLIWALDHDRATYRWHHVSSIIIFFVVIFLVLSGVWFSWMQFRHAHRLPSQDITATVTSATTQTPATPGAPLIATQEKDSVTEFSASPQGIKVASSAIGVIILVISMCFFYLYLDKVYPITVIPANQSGPSHSPAPK